MRWRQATPWVVGHDLHGLALGTEICVRRARRVAGEDEEQRAKRLDEDAEQEVSAGEEHHAGEHDEDEVKPDVEVLRAVDGGILLGKQLAEIPPGLEEPGADTALHTSGNLAIKAGEDAADERRDDEERKHADD